MSGQSGDLYPAEADRFSGEALCTQLLDLMADGRLKPSQLVSHRMAHTDMVTAYEMAYKREKICLTSYLISRCKTILIAVR